MNGTGNRLEKRAYALIVESGYENYGRFSVLDTAWPSVAPALPRFLAGPNDRLQTVCDALPTFLEFTGRWDEWQSFEQQAETKAIAAGDHANAGWRAKNLAYLSLLRRQADVVLACADRASAHWEKAFPQEKGKQAGVRERAFAILFRGHGYCLKKDFPTAIAAFREVVALFGSLSAESEDVALALSALADAECDADDFVAAERDYREALRVARAVGYNEMMAGIPGSLALMALFREDWPGAEKLAREALPLSEKVGRQELIAVSCERLAHALMRQGKGAEALPHARRAVEIYARLGSPYLASAREALQECESQ